MNKEHSLTDKVVIVTGGANGVGRSLVHEFLEENAKYVAIVDVDDVSGRELEIEIELKYGKGRAYFFKCDVAKLNELHRVYDEVMKANGVIDVVVNNAGIACETVDMYVKEIEINLTAVVSSSLKALELMRVDYGNKGGTIINISSITALTKSVSSLHIYAATKSAVMCFSNRLGMEGYYPRTNVRVLTVCLGPTDTQIVQTCEGFDEIANEYIRMQRSNYNDNSLLQKPEIAAKGIVESYKKGESGSTWFINNNKTTDITDKIKQADEIISSVIE